jgi:hypothetical protein
MYFYKIGYHTYEDSSYTEYYSDKKYTKEELEIVFLTAIKDCLEDNKDSFSLVNYEEYMNDDDYPEITDKYRLMCIEDVFYLRGLDDYLDKKGIHRISYTTKCTEYFGWSSIIEDRFKEEKDTANERLSKTIIEVFNK